MSDINSKEFWADAKTIDVNSKEFWADANVLQAESNTVFDEKTNKTISLPQTINSSEANYLIKRDVNKVKNFWAMEDVGAFEGLGKGVESFVKSMPQKLLPLVTEQAELTKTRNDGVKDKTYSMLGTYGNLMQLARVSRDSLVNSFGADKLIEKSNWLIERNKKYIADSNLQRPEGDTLASYMYDIGSGGGSLLSSIGVTFLTKTPTSAALFFGAYQKGNIYSEARAAGKTPEQASDISTLAGSLEAGLEFIGMDALLKTFKSNSYITRFAKGFATEFLQEGSQAISEESITQLSGVREKPFMDTVEDILYQAALGGILGGTASAAIGSIVRDEADKNGIDKGTTEKLVKYAEENFDINKIDLTEFIDKELAPIAADEKSAQEFITLMQKFGNDQDLVNPDSLTESEREVFNKYIEMFNNSEVDALGVQQVEKTVYDDAIAAGLKEETAVSASKLLGARADAASRAFGVTPVEWLKRQKLGFKTGGTASKDGETLFQSQFVSSVEQAVASFKQEKASGEQYLNMLKNTPGVKAEELDWMGLPEFLAGKKSVTKQEVMDFIAQNKVQMEEVTLGGSGNNFRFNSVDEYMAEIQKLERQKKFDEAEALTLEMERFDLGGDTSQGETKFNQYTLPGGENYREVLLTLPQKEVRGRTPLEIAHALGYDANSIYDLNPEQQKAVMAEYNKGVDAAYERQKNVFKSSHFDQPNILAHVRLNDRVDADGKKVLFVEEIQSDWHQAGRKKGYKTKENLESWYNQNKLDTDPPFADLSNEQIRIIEQNRNAGMGGDQGVPDAPFKKTWHELAFKRILQEAVDKGYDRVAWTTGEQQAERYDLSKSIERIDYRKHTMEDGSVKFKYAAVAKEGGRVIDTGGKWVSISEVEDNLGKDIAEKFSKEEGEKNSFRDENYDYNLSGLDLKVGGEGMKGFYDKIIPDYAKKLGKKYGAKVGETQVSYVDSTDDYIFVQHPNGSMETFSKDQMEKAKAAAEKVGGKIVLPDAEKHVVHSLDITPELRAAVEGGLSLFQQNRGQIQFFEDGRKIITLFENADESTILHELGHLFLRDMKSAAESTARPRVKKDFEEIKKWLGSKDGNFTIEQEEKFARGFEAYLRDGKAPKPELQGMFDAFKRWLTKIYKSIKDLDVEINPEISQIFDRMLGADFTKSTMADKTRSEINSDYERARTMRFEKTNKERAGDLFSSLSNWGANVFVPVSTRLGNVNSKLRDIIRKFEFDTKISALEDATKIKPWLEKIEKNISEEDYRVLTIALKNGDVDYVESLMKKHNMEAEYKSMRSVLDDIYIQAVDAGIDVGFVDNYFPRYVSRDKTTEYLAFLRGRDEWSKIEAALEEVDPLGKFTPDEKAEFANLWLRGYNQNKVNASAGSFGKERSIDYVTPEMNQFYEDSIDTLLRYVSRMRKNIEMAKIFGKNKEDIEQSIGKYVIGLVQDGVITAEQEQEVSDVLKAYFNAKGTHGIVAWLKDASYIYTMGSPISAITQIGDLGFSMAKNGVWNTARGLAKSITGNQRITRADIGIDNILQEFSTESKASNAVRIVFKAVGLDFMDNLGKETYLEGAFQRIKKSAKKDAQFKARLVDIFGTEADQTLQDILSEKMSSNVKYLLFSELADVQPIALSEMPAYYLNGGNWRVMYMLKTYTVKLLDVYRRDVFQTMKTDPIKGTQNLLRLAIALMLTGMSSDALKDLLLGREVEPDDLVIDNIIKLFGISKYNIWKARREGLANALMQYSLPPILAPVDDLSRDVVDTYNGNLELADWRLWGKTPVFGRFYYWWFGGGENKE